MTTAPSIQPGVPPVVSRPTVGALTDHDVAQRFKNVVVGFHPSQLAQAAKCTKEGAKHWVNGDRCPSLPKVLEMARTMPAVKAWLLHEMGEDAQFDHSKKIDHLLKQLQAQMDRQT